MTSTEKTVKVRLFLISDTHALSPTPTAPVFRTPLPKCDILIHAGDLTNTGKLDEHKHTMSWLKDVDAELKIIIAGNHDITLDEPFYTSTHNPPTHHTLRNHPPDPNITSRTPTSPSTPPIWHNPAQSPTQCLDLWTSPSATAAGIVYMTESTRTFTLQRKNARFKIHTSPYSPKTRMAWGFTYPRAIDRWNPLSSDPTTTAAGVPPVPGDIDILVTHGPAWGLHDLVAMRDERVGCRWLLKALERVRPRLHVCGHIHEGFGASRVVWEGEGEGEKERVELEALGWSETEELAERVGGCGAWEVDVSEGAEVPLGGKGRETLVVNASLVGYTMKAVRGGVLVDMELPVAGDGDG